MFTPEYHVASAKKTWVKPQLRRLKLTPKEIDILFPEAKDRLSKNWDERRQGRAA